MRLSGTIFISILVIFIAGIYIRSDAAIEILMVVPVLLTLFHKSKKIAVYVAIICSVLTLIAFLNSTFHTTNLLNFIISIAGIWLAFYFIIRFKNITETESKNKERLNALFLYATEGIVIASEKGEIVMINPKAVSQFGYDEGELNGKRIEVLIPERLSERHVKHREKYAHDPYPRPMGKGVQLFARRKDGSEFPVEISLSNFKTDEGKFVIAFIIDITARRKSEDQVQHEKEIAQMYLDIAPVIFLVLDKNGKVQLINQNGSRILNYSESEIIGQSWFDKFVAEGHRENSREIFIQLMTGKKSSSEKYENEIVTSNGENRLIAWKNTIIRDEKGSPVSILSSGEDITDSKKQELLLSKTNAELQQSTNEILKLNADLEKRVHERTIELAELINKQEAKLELGMW